LFHCSPRAEYTRERAPLQWAATQNNLGNALWTLGARESGTARLEEAVSAYREALKEYTCVFSAFARMGVNFFPGMNFLLASRKRAL
jgi:hypothetical protein